MDSLAIPLQPARAMCYLQRPMLYLWIAVGSALGGVARFWLAGWCATHVGDSFPWGTLIVNTSGSYAIGLIATLSGSAGPWLLEPDARHFLMAGFCGGYTTFSSFSLQTLHLAHAGEPLKAAGNIVLSVVLCLVAVWLGHLTALGVGSSGKG